MSFLSEVCDDENLLYIWRRSTKNFRNAHISTQRLNDDEIILKINNKNFTTPNIFPNNLFPNCSYFHLFICSFHDILLTTQNETNIFLENIKVKLIYENSDEFSMATLLYTSHQFMYSCSFHIRRYTSSFNVICP